MQRLTKRTDMLLRCGMVLCFVNGSGVCPNARRTMEKEEEIEDVEEDNGAGDTGF